MKAQVEMVSGRTTVTIEGQVLAVRDLQVVPSLELGIAPQLVIRLPADQEIDFDGVVYVEREPEERTIREAAAEWLAQTDLDALRTTVEAQMRTLSDDPITKTLEVLVAWVKGV